jgi:hypothetical protein
MEQVFEGKLLSDGQLKAAGVTHGSTLVVLRTAPPPKQSPPAASSLPVSFHACMLPTSRLACMHACMLIAPLAPLHAGAHRL